MIVAQPEATRVAAEGGPAQVGGEAHGELSCTMVFTDSSCMDANITAALWVGSLVIVLSVVAVVWLVRRSLRQRRR